MLAKTIKNVIKAGVIAQRRGLQFIPVQYNFCSQKIEFKAETNKLLQIVAKSLYTDKEVFLRELISNASDALEKRKFMGTEEDLKINIFHDQNKNQLIIQDNGIGMTREELVSQLGTIAKSGSEEFINNLNQQGDAADRIIGQFGVGFYSVFIVGDTVEVISRKHESNVAHRWVSEGEDSFEIQDIPLDEVDVGTKIIIHLKKDCRQFSEKGTIEKIIEKHSNFVEFPISINGELHNVINALWMKNKSEVSEEEYQKFYEYVANTKSKYQSKLHISIDAPLDLKALLYVPKTHNESFGISQEDFSVNLYCRKVLIKPKCKELLPNYLRFMKGAVDSQDISLNISRESYQDTQLMRQLSRLLTKRVLRFLDQQAKYDEEAYAKWYKDFNIFLIEGLSQDQDNQQELLKLTRYQSRNNQSVSLDSYIENKLEKQEKIYYILAQDKKQAESSPYLEPFKKTDLDIIYTSTHIDEMVFRNIGNYRNFKFVNIESDQDELKDLDQFFKDEHKEDPKDSKISEDDITSLCLFLKGELAPTISKVVVSNRLSNTPCLVQSPMSAGMRQMMTMMNQQGAGGPQLQTNMTMEINPHHNLISHLNIIRKSDQAVASLLARQLLDNSLILQNIQTDTNQMLKRIEGMMELIADQKVQQLDSQPKQENDDEIPDIQLDSEGNVSNK